MLFKTILACLSVTTLLAQNTTRDCVKLDNPSRLGLLKFSIGEGGCKLKNIIYPVMAEHLRPAEGFVYVTVLPKEVGSDGVGPKFISRSGEEKLAQLVLANVRTWNIKRDSSEFRIIFKFTVKTKGGAWDCGKDPIKPEIKMWVAPSEAIMVDFQSQINCQVFF